MSTSNFQWQHDGLICKCAIVCAYMLFYLFVTRKLNTIKERLGIASFRSSLATYSRAFIDQIIPDNVCRLLYIDSDTTR